MKIEFSAVVRALQASHGTAFSAMRADLNGLGRFASPVVGLDHFRMSGRTFAPHPHAGFAAITYMFEDSAGGLRNRDSLGHDFVAQAGELIWTQAGHGVIHDEMPDVEGKTVHGVQIFVNSSARYKQLPPKVQRLQRSEVPVFEAPGLRVRVLAGSYGELASPLQLQEPFTLLDVRFEGSMVLPLQQDWNAVLYMMSGSAFLRSESDSRTVTAPELIAVHSNNVAQIELIANQPSRALVLCGRDIEEPVVSYGPFIMTSEREIATAIQRYNAGGMGTLEPLPA